MQGFSYKSPPKAFLLQFLYLVLLHRSLFNAFPRYVGVWYYCFSTRISTPPSTLAHMTPRRLCSGGSGLAQLRLNLLRSAYLSHQKSSTFNEEPEKAPFPSQGSQICSYCTFIPRELSWSAYLYAWDPFLPSGCFTLEACLLRLK